MPTDAFLTRPPCASRLTGDSQLFTVIILAGDKSSCPTPVPLTPQE